MGAEYGDCIYDTDERAEPLSEEEQAELADVLSSAGDRLANERVAAGFRVVTSHRSSKFGPNNMRAPFGIVLHHTGGHFANDLTQLTRSAAAVSANDLVDKNGVIFELCEFPKRAWHAGEADLHGIRDWNTHGWGIEISNLGNNTDPYPAAQVDAVVWRCRERRRTLGISNPDMLVRHRDIAIPRGRKPDTSDSFPWQAVKQRVFAEHDPTDGGDPHLPRYRVIKRANDPTCFIVHGSFLDPIGTQGHMAYLGITAADIEVKPDSDPVWFLPVHQA